MFSIRYLNFLNEIVIINKRVSHSVVFVIKNSAL